VATPTVPPAGGDCPRCGAPYTPHQEYCLECGLRLPLDASPRDALAAAVGRRSAWYAGDWVWPTLVALVVAVLTSVAAVAIAAAREEERPLLINATTTQPDDLTGTTPATTGVAPVPGTVTLPEEEPPPPETQPPSPPPRQEPRVIAWPSGRDGFTVVLSSVPEGNRTQAVAKARQALEAGLDQVGVLQSARYSSLHPGYVVVFSGVYRSLEQAQEASARARDLAYRDAYAAQVAR
jgi:hypothetical protein